MHSVTTYYSKLLLGRRGPRFLSCDFSAEQERCGVVGSVSVSTAAPWSGYRRTDIRYGNSIRPDLRPAAIDGHADLEARRLGCGVAAVPMPCM